MGEENLEPIRPDDRDSTRELREEELRQIQAGTLPVTGNAMEQDRKKG